MEMLSARGVSKRFGGVQALRAMDFAAEAGEVHALLGENGAGKSTFIQILAGAVRPDAGEILLHGRPFVADTPARAKRAGIAAVFQELSLIPDFTVGENVWFGREQRGRLRMISRRRLMARTEVLFNDLGLGEIAPERTVRSLSVAERQLVEIAKLLAFDPALLILDEATSALAPREVDWLIATSRRLAAAGRLVLFISHRLAEVKRVADRISVLRNGEVVGTRGAGEVSEDEIVTLMLGRRLERLFPEPSVRQARPEALRLTGLSVGRRLRSVSLALHQGEILGVGGLQGHGQRELFLALVGVVRAIGRIEVGGRPCTIDSPRAALARGIGMALLPEDRRNEGLLLSRSLRENISLAALPRLTRWGLIDLFAERRLVGEAMRRLQIKAETPEQPADTLSGGNQQKAVLARLLESGARILLFYDPTRGVDVGTKAEIFRLMRDLAAQGYAILFHSTDLTELVHLSDRIAVLRYGELAAVLEGAALTEAEVLRATLAESAAA